MNVSISNTGISAESDKEGEEEGEEDAVPPLSADKDENELMELDDVEENPYVVLICPFSFLTASFSTVDIDLRSRQCFNQFTTSKDQDFVNACKLLVNCGDDLTQLNKLLKAVSILFLSSFHTIQCPLFI